jgi:hypothetical protein
VQTLTPQVHWLRFQLPDHVPLLIPNNYLNFGFHTDFYPMLCPVSNTLDYQWKIYSNKKLADRKSCKDSQHDKHEGDRTLEGIALLLL